jgi:hypothetical protein
VKFLDSFGESYKNLFPEARSFAELSELWAKAE